MKLKKRRYPFYVSIATLVVVIVVTLTGLFLWISHRESKVAAIQIADRLFSEINEKILGRYERSLESVAVLTGTAARMPGMGSIPQGTGISHPGIELMFKALIFYNSIFSTYIGYNDGSFIQLVAVRDQPEIRALFGAPEGTIFVLRTVTGDGPVLYQRWVFMNREREVLGERDDLDPGFDPRRRPWYLRAEEITTTFFTDPYIFSSTGLPGITCARRLQDGSGVFAIDITLAEFTSSLERQKISDNGVMFLFDKQGRIIAHPREKTIKVDSDGELHFLNGEELSDPLARAVVAEYRLGPAMLHNRTREMEIDGIAYLVRSTTFETDLKVDQILASVAPLSDFNAHIRHMEQRVFLLSFLVLVLLLPLTLLMSRTIARSLVQLEQESRKIQRSDFSESVPFDSSIKEIHSLITTFVLMKSTIRDYTARLIQAKREIEDLFTAVTELLAGAIDAKSPYTGSHCKRVPVLAKMLADAADTSVEAPFAGFRMDTEEKRREFEVAAWLHDCGKITTPEYVVDKATKLETIANRLHEIRMRFEVLLRDAEIDFYRRRLEGGEDGDVLQMDLLRKQQQIADDFTFVASCNIGGEFMADEQIIRLRQIATRTWVRHLDDRLGISQSEAALKNRQPPVSLPVVEQVLADRPEHLVPRAHSDPFDGNVHGFKMDVPEYARNLGELYNLSVRQGTLTEEDRFIINEHIIQTILMLKRLPFPEHMRNVADIAGAHHENMIGTGYPRRLKGEDMTLPARIMAIADIFEALTAGDRPYKRAKKLGDALRIMSRMRDDRHIDADLFNLFLTSGVYRTYAERFLTPAQMEEIEIKDFLV